MEAGLHQASFHLVAAQGIGTVQDHDFDALLGAGTHHQAQRADERIRTAPHILDVIDHHIQALKHLGRGFAIFPINGIHGDAGLRIGRVFHLVTRIGIAPHAMLGSEKGFQFHTGCSRQDIDGRTQVPVDAAGVGHQPHFFPFQAGETAVTQDLYPGADLGAKGYGRQQEGQQR